MRAPTWLVPLGVLLTAGLLAADGKAPRVFDPPRLPDDVRLGKPASLDTPTPFKPAFKTKEEWEARAKELREQVLVANGLWPLPERTPLNPVVHGTIDRDEYTIEKVFFASLPGHYVCGNLYRPKNKPGRRPAVLSPHGHWANGRMYERPEAQVKQELASGGEKTPEGARYPLQARCAMLARMGCVVFHYDMVGYADSTAIPHRAGFTDAEAELRLQSFMGLQTWNAIRALDFLAGLPDVDPKRIAVTGASGGGTQTFILCAIDDRPAVSFPAVMVSMNMQGGCICENCSHLRVGTNNVELAALFAPKPQAMTGADDWTRDIETRGLPELKAIYRLYGADEKVAAKYFPYPHNYNQVSREMMYNWLNKHLNLGLPEPIVEKPFQPVPPKELSVFDADHPRPKDSADAAGVRKYLTASSDRQLRTLAKDPAEYRRVVATALRVLVHDKPPARVAPVPDTLKRVQGDGYELHLSLLTRPGSSVQIPAVGVVPEGWNGTVVVWAHPDGKASLFAADGTPTAAVRQLLARKVAVLSADLFLTGEYHLPNQPTPIPWFQQKYHKDLPFAGYYYGYNRSLIAQRVHDLLTVIAFPHQVLKAKEVHLVAFGKAGPWALLARALAGDQIKRAAIDLNGFDFDQVQATNDEQMLPGALKYGGIYGFVPLCTSGATILYNAPKGGQRDLAAQTQGVTLQDAAAKPEEMTAWLLR
jgi:dienelactone hydrolase